MNPELEYSTDFLGDFSNVFGLSLSLRDGEAIERAVRRRNREEQAYFEKCQDAKMEAAIRTTQPRPANMLVKMSYRRWPLVIL